MRRRYFITLLGVTAAAWPLAGRTQQPTLPVVGFMRGSTPEAGVETLAAFRRGLSETGYVEPQDCHDRISLGGGERAR
jgi:putative tryptophan/tyrosine transport system substrate-binding protein